MAGNFFYVSLLLSLLALVSADIIGDIQRHGIFGLQDLESQTRGINGRIVNGTKAILGQFPHLVSLRRSWSAAHFCGGSVIAETWVLTAAHCMFMNDEQILPWSIVVIGGEIRLNQATKTGQRSGVEYIYIHPQFNSLTLENDAALLELKVPFEFTSELRPVAFPTVPFKPATYCQVSGWGYPREDIRIISNDLMFVDLPIMEIKQCRKLLVNVSAVPPGMFCAGYLEGLRDACQGDSGGGMVCNGFLTGVVSGGDGCANPRLPGLYTDVYFYKEWIAKTIGMSVLRTGRSSPRNSAVNAKPAISLIAICSMIFMTFLRH